MLIRILSGLKSYDSKRYIMIFMISVNGRPKTLLVHRKGSTRAFPPHHPLIPVDYQMTGQPVLIGGTMGSCSYVLTGTEKVSFLLH